MINFSISEISGRTFEVPKEKLEEKYKELGYEIYADTTLDEMINEVLTDDLTNLDEFEKANDYFEWNLEEIKEK